VASKECPTTDFLFKCAHPALDRAGVLECGLLVDT
jgi:hypothetical protein